MAPLLTFTSTFPATMEVGDLTIPIKVARLDKATLDEVDAAWARLVVVPRGAASAPDQAASAEEKAAYTEAERVRLESWHKEVAVERFEFFQKVITDYITLDAGLIEDEGEPVTTGAGLLKIFHGRRDLLRDLIFEVITKNHLTAVMAKNSNSPRDSVGGLPPRVPTPGGDAQGSTAPSAERSTSAAPAAATASSGPAPAGGLSDEGGKVH